MNATHAFVAYLACGHVIGMVVDLGEDDEDLDLASFYKENVGREIRRIPLEEARKSEMYVRGCAACAKVMSNAKGERDADKG